MKLKAFVPAHKQTDPEAKPGQIVNPLGFVIDSKRKPMAATFNVVNAQKRKLTFNEWLDEYYPPSERPDQWQAQFAYLQMMQDAWKAGQENV
jgi:hypothetical protein